MIIGGCRLCGGTAGDPRQQAHSLCMALAEQGQPTPKLGDECPCCKGAGCHPRSTVGPINPSQDMMERWAPGCVTCKARGWINRDPDHPLAASIDNEPTKFGNRSPKHWFESCQPEAI